jgi:hypothetical protein
MVSTMWRLGSIVYSNMRFTKIYKKCAEFKLYEQSFK